MASLEARSAQAELPHEQAGADAQRRDPPGGKARATQEREDQRDDGDRGEEAGVDRQGPVARTHDRSLKGTDTFSASEKVSVPFYRDKFPFISL